MFCSMSLCQGETRSRNVIGCYCDKNMKSHKFDYAVQNLYEGKSK